MRKKIIVKAPVLSQSGYGEQSRFALRALRSREDIYDIYIMPLRWGQTGWIWEENEFRRWLDDRIQVTQEMISSKRLQADISLQITIPDEFEKMAPINIGYTAGIETTNVAPQWLVKGNDMDKILVVSNHSRNTYRNTTAKATNNATGEEFDYGLQTPIEVVWENTPTEEPEELQQLKLDYDFNFLIVSQMGQRKNFDNAIKWWIEEFFDQEVGLVIKTNLASNCIMDYDATVDALKAAVHKYPDRKCKIYLLHGDMPRSQMLGLYTNEKIKAIVNIAHGEGFGLPLFEAARHALPIITIGWSGQVDFLFHDDKEYYNSVEYNIQPVQDAAVWPGVIEKNSGWAFADQGSYKMTLRKVYKNWDKAKELALELQPIVLDKFSDEKLYELFNSHLEEYCSTISDDDWLSEMDNIVKEYE